MAGAAKKDNTAQASRTAANRVRREKRHAKRMEKQAAKVIKVPRGTARAERRLKENVRGRWMNGQAERAQDQAARQNA